MYSKNSGINEFILNEIMKNGSITQKEMAKSFNVSERTIRRHMRDLKKKRIISLKVNGKDRIWKIL